jgi:hypothetical protein
MCDRALERHSPHTESLAPWAARIQHWGVLCYLGFDKLKNKGMFGTVITGQRLLKQKILVPARTPGDITIQYLRCVRRVATLSFVVSACQFVRPQKKQLVSPLDIIF